MNSVGERQLTPELGTRIVEGVMLGLHRDAVAGYAGIDPGVFARWFEDGSQSIRSPYRGLWRSVMAALFARTMMRMRSTYLAAMRGDQAAAAEVAASGFSLEDFGGVLAVQGLLPGAPECRPGYGLPS